MMPAAPLDDTPRPKAVAAPRGVPGDGLSTAALPKHLDGGEEATYEFPIPPAPKETVAPLQVDLPPAPPVAPAAMPLTPAPPALPLAPVEPLAAPQSLAPPSPVFQQPVLAPPVEVAQKPQVDAKPTSNVVNQPSPSELAGNLRALYDKANQRISAMDTYTMRIRRREVVGGRSRPEELMLAKFRQKPFSIYMKWVGEEGKNREVCYVKGKYDDCLHTLLAPGDMFPFGGKYMKFKIDNPLVMSNCRYPISDAGLSSLIARFGKLVTAIEKGEGREGSARYLGKLKRPEFTDQVEGVVQVLPAKYDPLLPGGGQRYWYFDATNGLPALIVTIDHQGREVEYYCHDLVQGPVNLDDDDFNPHRLWKAAVK